MSFFKSQKKMTRQDELAMLRGLHSLEAVANAADKKEAPAAEEVDTVDSLAKRVKTLKAKKAPKEEIEAAVKLLLAAKEKQAEKLAVDRAAKQKDLANRAVLEDILLRKFFYVPSFEIYGGVAGLYDFGPTGCALKSNLIQFWRQHFVLQESMLEVASCALTPDVVLRTSGHVEKFTDFMVKDMVTLDCHRADKLLEDFVDKTLDDPKCSLSAAEKKQMLADKSNADAFSCGELGDVLKKYGVKAPDTGNDISDPFPFNLMFETQIGPTGKHTGYMRPETAQGIFVNFRRLLEYNAAKMPFAAAQIGLAFRNEIAPRAGLLRVREFTLAEIEHFVKPDDKSHPSFAGVAHLKMQLLCKGDQTGEDICKWMTIGEAVKTGMVNNETLGYYMARTQMFLTTCGIILEKLRFRQHKDTEMAHYAADCWDAEIYSSYGWIECVGHADRSAYDLKVHSNMSKVDLSAQHSYATPQMEEVLCVKPNAGLIGKTFRKDAKIVREYLSELTKVDGMKLQKQLETNGKHSVSLCDGNTYEITKEMVTLSVKIEKISVVKYIPSVIEPSFGIGRIMYSILEHSFHVRKKKDGTTANILRLSPTIAPIKCAINPLATTPALAGCVNLLEKGFIEEGLASRTDASGVSIGRKYARNDEIGVPFQITVDFDYEKDKCITIRERDTMQQVRMPATEAVDAVLDMVNSDLTWAELHKKYGIQVESVDESA